MAMKIGFGPMTAQKHPDDQRTQGEIYRADLELAVEAERLGFDSVWVAEHHFIDDGFLPSLLVMCAAIAARTERIQIGAGAVNAPFFNPAVIAEEAAVVDLLSNGRLILALGQGWRPEEIEAFGLTRPQLRNRFLDAFQLLKTAGRGGAVTPPGSSIPVHITPRPERPEGVPIWFGAEAEVAIRRAGELSDGWFGTMLTAEDFARGCNWVLEGMDKAGRQPADVQFGLHHAVFVWEDGDAWEQVRRGHQGFVHKADQIDFEYLGQGRGPEVVAFDDRPEGFARDLIVCGTPDQVVEQIMEYQAAVDQPIHFVARNYFPGMSPAVQRESMRLLAQKVAPRLRVLTS